MIERKKALEERLKEGVVHMSPTQVKQDDIKQIEENRLEVRNLVLAGYEQAKKENTKSLDSVCERLERKYNDAILQN